MEREARFEQPLNVRFGDGDDGGGDPEPDSACPGLLGCSKYDPCPIEAPVVGLAGSSMVAREVARRVKTRLHLEE